MYFCSFMCLHGMDKGYFTLFRLVKWLLASSYRGAGKSLARPTSRYILFDGENISFDSSLGIYITSTNIPPIMIINRIFLLLLLLLLLLLQSALQPLWVLA